MLKKCDRKAVRERTVDWAEQLEPFGTVEECFITRAAVASVRLERCVEKEFSDLARRRKRAGQRWEARQRKLVEGCVHRLERSPAAAVRDLHAFTRGCDWLLGEWRTLTDAIESRGGWSVDQAEHALRLLGKEPASPYPGVHEVAALRCCLLAVLVAEAADNAAREADDRGASSAEEASVPVAASDVNDLSEPGDPTSLPSSSAHEQPQILDLREAIARLGADPDLLPPLPTPDEAREALKGLLASQVAHVEAKRRRAWLEKDGPDYDDSQAHILIDTGTRGMSLLRHEASNDLIMHRNLKHLFQMRKMEPDVATLKRFEWTRKAPSRIFTGTKWIPYSEYAAGDPRPHGAEERPNPCDGESSPDASSAAGDAFRTCASPGLGGSWTTAAPETDAGSSREAEAGSIVAGDAFSAVCDSTAAGDTSRGVDSGMEACAVSVATPSADAACAIDRGAPSLVAPSAAVTTPTGEAQSAIVEAAAAPSVMPAAKASPEIPQHEAILPPSSGASASTSVNPPGWSRTAPGVGPEQAPGGDSAVASGGARGQDGAGVS